VEVDVAVVGAGPAGAMAALALAPTHRVLVIERGIGAPRVGESLLPAARRLFANLGLLAELEEEGHAPWYGNTSDWGGVGELDFLRDPDGPGWHLDRARFDAWLLARARDRGAVLLRPASVRAAVRTERGFRLQVGFLDDPGTLEVEARGVVDAGGRASAVSPSLGAVRTHADRLFAGWCHGRGAGPAVSSVIAEADGWWYTAPIPEGRRVLAFHTDADLPSAADTRDPKRLLARAAKVAGLEEVLRSTTFGSELPSGVVSARTAWIAPAAGSGWIAAGDAALAFDPLSSRGIFHALVTGLAAAEALDRDLAGKSEPREAYLGMIERVRATYLRERADAYRAEDRWRDRPFWTRRRATA
jgi:flavin-dependent dehydrogenase